MKWLSLAQAENIKSALKESCRKRKKIANGAA
jgi:hypothetical protein